MKVYRIRTDVNNYQYFLADREEEELKLFTNCEPRLHDWSPPKVYIYKPKHKAGEFYSFHSNSLITSPRATQILGNFLEMAGELLPLPYNDQIFTLLNVTNCINCLDQEHSEWVKSTTGENAYPKKYVFHPHRFSSSPIFKIPETCRSEILVVDRDQEIEEELRSMVEKEKLQGLLFEELWSYD